MKHQLKRQKRRRQGCKRRQTGSTEFRFETGVLHRHCQCFNLWFFLHMFMEKQVSPWYPSCYPLWWLLGQNNKKQPFLYLHGALKAVRRPGVHEGGVKLGCCHQSWRVKSHDLDLHTRPTVANKVSLVRDSLGQKCWTWSWWLLVKGAEPTHDLQDSATPWARLLLGIICKTSQVTFQTRHTITWMDDGMDGWLDLDLGYFSREKGQSVIPVLSEDLHQTFMVSIFLGGPEFMP